MASPGETIPHTDGIEDIPEVTRCLTRRNGRVTDTNREYVTSRADSILSGLPTPSKTKWEVRFLGIKKGFLAVEIGLPNTRPKTILTFPYDSPTNIPFGD